CTLRLRPIVMTSFAFILGVLPLIISHGAGAEMRRTLGTAVFSGMGGVTLFGIVLTPVFFSTIDRLGGSRLFASPAGHRVGASALWVLRLEFLLPPLRAAFARLSNGRKPRVPAVTSVSNGAPALNGAPEQNGGRNENGAPAASDAAANSDLQPNAALDANRSAEPNGAAQQNGASQQKVAAIHEATSPARQPITPHSEFRTPH